MGNHTIQISKTDAFFFLIFNFLFDIETVITYICIAENRECLVFLFGKNELIDYKNVWLCLSANWLFIATNRHKHRLFDRYIFQTICFTLLEMFWMTFILSVFCLNCFIKCFADVFYKEYYIKWMTKWEKLKKHVQVQCILSATLHQPDSAFNKYPTQPLQHTNLIKHGISIYDWIPNVSCMWPYGCLFNLI